MTFHVTNSYLVEISSVMTRKTYHEQVLRNYLMHMVLRDIILPPLDEDLADQIQLDLTILEGIRTTRYLRPRTSVAKSGNLHLSQLQGYRKLE